MNFFASLAQALNGPLGAIKTQELNVVGPALASVIPALLAHPTKAGLIAAAAPAVIQIAAVQPQVIEELLADLFNAVGQLASPAAPIQTLTPPKAP
jgi:hypothetical protein